MIPTERRWATPAVAVLAFCLTLVVISPPLQPYASVADPTALIANGVAASAGHVFMGLIALAGLLACARHALKRPKLNTQEVRRNQATHAA